MTTAPAWDEARALSIITGLKDLDGACLPILHALQEEFGYVHKDAIPMISDALALSKAEVVGVLDFYHDFRKEPPGRYVMKVCRAEACQSMGCEPLVSHIEKRLDVAMGGTTSDGEFTLETVYCLGNCALSPAIIINEKLYGRVSPHRADKLIEAARSAR